MIEQNEIKDWGFDVDCDKCSYYELIDEIDFRDVIKEMKSRGWKIIKDKDGEWKHLCPSCAEEE